ncbi:hypothetical protein PIB30_029546 [Stylosanthes scabra]|uniref:Uncharacterized protein n=1 Tax=Stylosanthes scabra TaxID=79078 RepID=A0ABU6VB26_9FABA|nr:hypothetical protein [Stylosanthes scabra]
MRPFAPRPPRPVGSPSSSASAGSSGSVHREREHSPRTPLPTPAPMHVPASMHPPPRTPMMDARRYRNLFPRRRVAPPTPLPSDDEPSDEGDCDDSEDSQTASDTSLSSRDISSAGASYGSERESSSFSSGPSDCFSSGSSSGGSSVGSGSVTSGSASDASSDDDLLNRYFAGTLKLSLDDLCWGGAQSVGSNTQAQQERSPGPTREPIDHAIPSATYSLPETLIPFPFARSKNANVHTFQPRLRGLQPKREPDMEYQQCLQIFEDCGGFRASRES